MEQWHDKLFDRIQFDKFKVIHTNKGGEKTQKPNYACPVMDANLAITSQERDLEIIADLAMILPWKCQLCSAAAKKTNRTLGIIWKALRA